MSVCGSPGWDSYFDDDNDNDNFHNDDPVQFLLDAATLRLLRPWSLRDYSLADLPSQAITATDSCAVESDKDGCAVEKQDVTEQEQSVPKERLSLLDSGKEFLLDRPTKISVQGNPFLKLFALSRYPHPVPRAQSPADHLAFKVCSGRSALMAVAEKVSPIERAMFEPFDHGHQDLVLAVDFDYTGHRLVTASSDHRLKVFNKKDDGYELVDTWRAHDAEIVDVKFNGPFSTPTLASIAEDARLKLWAEDPLATQNSGTRFKMIWSQRSETGVPFCSLSIKYLQVESYIAAITRDGFLNIYEPVDFDDLSGEWGRIHSEFVCATPSPAEETSFRVDWHKESLPAWTAIEAGLDRKALSLAIAAMEEIIIMRTDRDKRFYTAITIPRTKGIVRDLAWSNGAMRGYDLVAAAYKDSGVRIFEITTPRPESANVSQPLSISPSPPAASITSLPLIIEPDDTATDVPEKNKISPSGSAPRSGEASPRSPMPGLISNLSRSTTSLSPSAPSYEPGDGSSTAVSIIGTDNGLPSGAVMQEATCVAHIAKEHGNVWRIAWSFMGDLLLTTGDDGVVRAWKKTAAGEWLEAAAVEGQVEPEQDE